MTQRSEEWAGDGGGGSKKLKCYKTGLRFAPALAELVYENNTQ